MRVLGEDIERLSVECVILSRGFTQIFNETETRAKVYECLAYYEDHRAEIDTLVAMQMSEPAI